MASNIIYPLSSALWGSAMRADGIRKYLTLNENGGLIPPDVAHASDQLLMRQKRSYAGVIQTIQPYENEVNDKFAEQLNVPSGQSVFTPIYSQYTKLESIPPLMSDPSVLWQDMPQEMYLVNRLNSASAEERAILSDLGYDSIYEIAKSGGDFTPDWLATETEKAYEVQKTLVDGGIFTAPSEEGDEKNPAATVVMQVLESQWFWRIAGSAALIGAVWVGVPALFDYLKSKSVAEATRALAYSDAKRAEFQIRMCEQNNKVTDYCLAWAERNNAEPDRCLDFQRSLPQQVIPSTLDGAMAGMACGGWQSCSTWLLLAGAVGMYGGWLAGERIRRSTDK